MPEPYTSLAAFTMMVTFDAKAREDFERRPDKFIQESNLSDSDKALALRVVNPDPAISGPASQEVASLLSVSGWTFPNGTSWTAKTLALDIIVVGEDEEDNDPTSEG